MSGLPPVWHGNELYVPDQRYIVHAEDGIFTVYRLALLETTAEEHLGHVIGSFHIFRNSLPVLVVPQSNCP